MTLLNRFFKVASLGAGTYSAQGDWIPGALSVRDVKGTIQPLSSKDTLVLETGSRDTGMVKIYAAERLAVREREEGAQGDFIEHGGRIYQAHTEDVNQNGLLPHWKYFASMCPLDKVPTAVRTALLGGV